jgi:hypothetical protein
LKVVGVFPRIHAYDGLVLADNRILVLYS